MTSTPTTSETLNLAADLLQERGWTTGNKGMVATGDPLCLMGAIGAAAGLATRVADVLADSFGSGAAPVYPYAAVMDCPAARAVTAYLDEFELWMWNDDQTDVAEVIATLRAVALIEAAREDAALLAEMGTA